MRTLRKRGDEHMMFIRKGKKNVLENEPYETFIKLYSKLESIINENIHMRIAADTCNKKTGFVGGFVLDYIYTKYFDLDFQFALFIDEERIQNQKFCVFHTLSFMFDDENFQGMMMDTIGDIQKRNGYLYISSSVQECEVNCSVNNKNVVSISFCVCCKKEDAKEVCLQLISHDIALFSRSF